MEWRRAPITSRAKATFSRTVLLGRSLKSWNTQPIARRSAGTFQEASRFNSLPATHMRPALGRSSLISRRMKVDLPEPDWPTTKTNSPLPISTETSSRAMTSLPYTFVTWSSLITLRATFRSGAPHGWGWAGARVAIGRSETLSNPEAEHLFGAAKMRGVPAPGHAQPASDRFGGLTPAASRLKEPGSAGRTRMARPRAVNALPAISTEVSR